MPKLKVAKIKGFTVYEAVDCTNNLLRLSYVYLFTRMQQLKGRKYRKKTKKSIRKKDKLNDKYPTAYSRFNTTTLSNLSDIQQITVLSNNIDVSKFHYKHTLLMRNWVRNVPVQKSILHYFTAPTCQFVKRNFFLWFWNNCVSSCCHQRLEYVPALIVSGCWGESSPPWSMERRQLLTKIWI